MLNKVKIVHKNKNQQHYFHLKKFQNPEKYFQKLHLKKKSKINKISKEYNLSHPMIGQEFIGQQPLSLIENHLFTHIPQFTDMVNKQINNLMMK